MPIGKPKNRSFVQRQVWNYVKRHGPVGREKVAQAFGCSRVAAGMNLRRLYDRGCLFRFGAAKRTLYVAAPSPPEDMRGTAKASLQALDKSGKRAQSRTRGRGVSKTDAPLPPIPSLSTLLLR